MKNLAMITLIGLIGLTCFITTDAYSSDSDRDARMSRVPGMTFVYGYAWVKYFYTFPVVSSSHVGYIANDSGGIHPDWPEKILIEYYIDFECRLIGEFPRWFTSYQTWGTHGWLAARDTYGVSNGFNFDLTRIIWDQYGIQANSKIEVKVDNDEDGAWDAMDAWKAEINEIFFHREEALGID